MIETLANPPFLGCRCFIPAVRIRSCGFAVAHLRHPTMGGEGCEYVFDFEVFARSIFNAPLTMTGANRAGDRFGH
jgi:hypothetical protein